jgi:hypothetical protein
MRNTGFDSAVGPAPVLWNRNFFVVPIQTFDKLRFQVTIPVPYLDHEKQFS